MQKVRKGCLSLRCACQQARRTHDVASWCGMRRPDWHSLASRHSSWDLAWTALLTRPLLGQSHVPRSGSAGSACCVARGHPRLRESEQRKQSHAARTDACQSPCALCRAHWCTWQARPRAGRLELAMLSGCPQVLHSDQSAAARCMPACANSLASLEPFLARAQLTCAHTAATKPVVVLHADGGSRAAASGALQASLAACGPLLGMQVTHARPTLCARVRHTLYARATHSGCSVHTLVSRRMERQPRLSLL